MKQTKEEKKKGLVPVSDKMMRRLNAPKKVKEKRAKEFMDKITGKKEIDYWKGRDDDWRKLCTHQREQLKDFEFELKIKYFIESNLGKEKIIKTSDVLDYVYKIIVKSDWHPTKLKRKIVKEIYDRIERIPMIRKDKTINKERVKDIIKSYK